jgi:hypothetical protein
VLAKAQARNLIVAGKPADLATRYFAILWVDLLIRLLTRLREPPLGSAVSNARISSNCFQQSLFLQGEAVVRDREKPGAERIAILGLGPGDYRGACLLRQVETMF